MAGQPQSNEPSKSDDSTGSHSKDGRTTEDFYDDGDAKFDPIRCPHCGYELDAASVVGKEPVFPDDGDYSVCFGCGDIAIFTVADDGKLGMRTPHVSDVIPPNVYRVSWGIKAYRKRHPRETDEYWDKVKGTHDAT